MIFTGNHAAQVLDGRKWQTRRPVKPGEYGHQTTAPNYFDKVFRFGFQERKQPKWQVGKTYAVQPGRGKKAVGRIRIMKIRRERLQEISLRDMRAEGIWIGPDRTFPTTFSDELADMEMIFKEVWNFLYRKSYRWEDNPEVWVLKFELVKEGQ